MSAAATATARIKPAVSAVLNLVNQLPGIILFQRIAAFIAFLGVYSCSHGFTSFILAVLYFIWSVYDAVSLSRRTAYHYSHHNIHTESLIRLIGRNPTDKDHSQTLRRFEPV
jgi:hypothetical protein